MTETTQVSVIIPASHSHTGQDRRDIKLIDAGVADIVGRLNDPRLGDAPFTCASCDGHGTGPAYITLLDGRTLVVADDEDEVDIIRLALGFNLDVHPRKFRLVRRADPTGVSGTGHVANGWLIGDVAVVRWLGDWSTTTIHRHGMASVEAIHGHGGNTVIEWLA